MPDVHCRIAEEKDLTIILSMMADFNAIDHYPFDLDKGERNLKAFMLNQDLGRIWLIEESGIIVGYIVLTFGYSFEYGGKDAFIDELFLKEDHRAKGIGSLVMDFVVERAKELDIQAIHLEVEKHNLEGNRLYLKKGFKSGDRILMSRRTDQ